MLRLGLNTSDLVVVNLRFGSTLLGIVYASFAKICEIVKEFAGNCIFVRNKSHVVGERVGLLAGVWEEVWGRFKGFRLIGWGSLGEVQGCAAGRRACGTELGWKGKKVAEMGNVKAFKWHLTGWKFLRIFTL